MPNVDMFIPEKDTEMRMGRITTDWLYAQLDHHGLEVGAYKGRQRQYLVAELRKLGEIGDGRQAAPRHTRTHACIHAHVHAHATRP